MTPTTLWNKFKEIPWYFKIILFLPLIIMLAVFFMMGQKPTRDEDVVKHSKSKTDKVLDEYVKQTEHVKKEREKIANQRAMIKKDIENAQGDYTDIIKRIDTAPADELDSIAAELRANRRNNR